jgi:hypothetical protein
MKLSLTVEADAINVLALNMGRIAVDIDGIELADLIDVVCDNGYSLRVADEPGKLVVEDPLPPVARVNGIQCSTAHITAEDNALLFTLSHQHEDFGESEWISYTGSGYLLPGRVVVSGLTPQTPRSVESLPSVSGDAYPSLRRWHCSSGCLWRSAAGLCHL